VADMRAKIAKEHPAPSLWSVKYLRGGLMDLEFLAEYLILRHAHDHPDVVDGSTQAAFAKLSGAGVIGGELARRLIEATRLMRQVQAMLRLIAAPAYDADAGSESVKSSLARSAGMGDFAALRDALVTTAQTVQDVFVDMIEEPARALATETIANKTEAGLPGAS
jgi:glutamate-ammonia-ligase adenylyltransferase